MNELLRTSQLKNTIYLLILTFFATARLKFLQIW